MINLSFQPYPLPSNPSPATLLTHPLSPTLINAILSSPCSRYSKLASIITQAQSIQHRPTSSSVPPTPSTITVSLPPLNHSAVKFLLCFIESGTPATKEAETIRKADIRRAFEVLGVDFPPGFDYAEGDVDGLGLSSKEYIRRKEDYSSPEIYEALRRMEMEEGFGVDVNHSLGIGGGSNSHSSSAYRARASSSNSIELPPSYAASEVINPRNNTLSPYRNGNMSDSKDSEKPEPQSEFHATLQGSLLDKLYNLILSHIKPALSTQAQLGIFRGRFILLADPNYDLEGPAPMSQIVTSSPHDQGDNAGHRTVLYLPSHRGAIDGFTQEFLIQPTVVKGIKSTVEDALGVQPPPPRPPTPPPVSPPPQKSKGWFGFGRKKTVKEAPTPVVVEEPEPSTIVDVQVEDIFIRKENEDGLWETRRVKGVVVWIEVREV